MVAEYLSAAAEDENPNVFLKALSVGAYPRFETVHAVLGALGVKMTLVPAEV